MSKTDKPLTEGGAVALVLPTITVILTHIVIHDWKSYRRFEILEAACGVVQVEG